MKKSNCPPPLNICCILGKLKKLKRTMKTLIFNECRLTFTSASGATNLIIITATNFTGFNAMLLMFRQLA
jgi:hypothetical protein